ncbi:MAG: MBL fold metallo-hydrolase [Candidatus Marsarchaeota archaeon]|nr:MBL fold metallo-hydrolase [Candidatus Marsarchaeota archaeon]MCL5094463.1 MBL fold metallo-hydrolase [Candidatus Marsarchaeota archaeon]
MLNINNLKISLDQKNNGSTIDFISHAHFDHISALNSSKHIIASQQTIELIKTRSKNLNSNYLNFDYEKFNIELLNSGHILGSKQLFIQDNIKNESTIYSGDFQIDTPLIAEPIQIKPADILILDSTYPDPKIKFDEKKNVKQELKTWVSENIDKGIILFGAYSLGRAQDLIKILNEIDIIPLVNKEINNINKIYQKNGFALRYASVYDENSNCNELLKHNFVGIVQINKLKELKINLTKIYNKRIYSAVATGMVNVFNFNVDAKFELSNHADFEQSVSYIEHINPKKIFTYGKNKEIFANNLSKLNYTATPFL